MSNAEPKYDASICDRCGTTNLEETDVTVLMYSAIPGTLNLDFVFGNTKLVCNSCMSDIFEVIREYE